MQIENEKLILTRRSEKRKELQNSMKESLNSLCKNYEDALNDFQRQTLDIDNDEDQLEKVIYIYIYC